MCVQVNRIYDDETFQATAAQTAQLHIVLAICHFQYGALARQKNPGHVPQAAVNSIKTSNRHYHYTMSLMYDLLNDTSLEDLQAIGLILQHLRSFPKPGGSWILSRIAISLCLEHGLHRSAKKWKYNLVPNFIEIEMRKRVFWCILALEVSLASKLGRPMSIKQGDFDAEFPERVDDEYILEGEIIKKGEDEDQDCRIDIAIDMFKHALLTIEIHTKLYGVSRPERNVYVSVVESIEAKLDKWRAGCCKTISRTFYPIHQTSTNPLPQLSTLQN